MGNFIQLASKIQDNARDGYFGNYLSGLRQSVNDKLPMFAFNSEGTSATITSVTATRVNINGVEFETITLPTSCVKYNASGYYYYDETVSLGVTFDDCIYYLTISNGIKTWKSQFFTTFEEGLSFSVTFDSEVTTFDIDSLTFDQTN